MDKLLANVRTTDFVLPLLEEINAVLDGALPLTQQLQQVNQILLQTLEPIDAIWCLTLEPLPPTACGLVQTPLSIGPAGRNPLV